MKRITAIAIIAALFAGFVAHAAEEKKAGTQKPAEAKEQTHGPVMQRYPVDKNHVDRY